MAVLKEWACLAHGAFESAEQKCPHGCSVRFVKREFRTAPSIRHRGTSNRDALAQQLANDYGLTNLANEGGQASVMQSLRKKNWADYKRGGVAPSAWAEVPHNEPGWAQEREEKPKCFKPEQMGLKSGAALKQGALPKPRPVIVKDSKGQPLSYKAPLPEVSE